MVTQRTGHTHHLDLGLRGSEEVTGLKDRVTRLHRLRGSCRFPGPSHQAAPALLTPRRVFSGQKMMNREQDPENQQSTGSRKPFTSPLPVHRCGGPTLDAEGAEGGGCVAGSLLPEGGTAPFLWPQLQSPTLREAVGAQMPPPTRGQDRTWLTRGRFCIFQPLLGTSAQQGCPLLPPGLRPSRPAEKGLNSERKLESGCSPCPSGWVHFLSSRASGFSSSF
nr:uncharacterized protein LOC123277264 [Equus asinus]